MSDNQDNQKDHKDHKDQKDDLKEIRNFCRYLVNTKRNMEFDKCEIDVRNTNEINRGTSRKICTITVILHRDPDANIHTVTFDYFIAQGVGTAEQAKTAVIEKLMNIMRIKRDMFREIANNADELTTYSRQAEKIIKDWEQKFPTRSSFGMDDKEHHGWGRTSKEGFLEFSL